MHYFTVCEISIKRRFIRVCGMYNKQSRSLKVALYVLCYIGLYSFLEWLATDGPSFRMKAVVITSLQLNHLCNYQCEAFESEYLDPVTWKMVQLVASLEYNLALALQRQWSIPTLLYFIISVLHLYVYVISSKKYFYFVYLYSLVSLWCVVNKYFSKWLRVSETMPISYTY